jgi:hypothetical protein
MKEQITVQQLKGMLKEDALKQIRKILAFDDATRKSLFKRDGMSDEHYRFDMSGYESIPGACTIHNQFVLNKFAFLGIYDYTRFLALDFYKGQGTLYFSYWNDQEVHEEEFGGMGTCEIIYQILEMTVFTNKTIRRR